MAAEEQAKNRRRHPSVRWLESSFSLGADRFLTTVRRETAAFFPTAESQAQLESLNGVPSELLRLGVAKFDPSEVRAIIARCFSNA